MHFAIHAFIIRMYNVCRSFRLSLGLLKMTLSVMAVILILIIKGLKEIVRTPTNIIGVRIKLSKLTSNYNT